MQIFTINPDKYAAACVYKKFCPKLYVGKPIYVADFGKGQASCQYQLVFCTHKDHPNFCLNISEEVFNVLMGMSADCEAGYKMGWYKAQVWLEMGRESL